MARATAISGAQYTVNCTQEAERLLGEASLPPAAVLGPMPPTRTRQPVLPAPLKARLRQAHNADEGSMQGGPRHGMAVARDGNRPLCHSANARQAALTIRRLHIGAFRRTPLSPTPVRATPHATAAPSPPRPHRPTAPPDLCMTAPSIAVSKRCRSRSCAAKVRGGMPSTRIDADTVALSIRAPAPPPPATTALAAEAAGFGFGGVAAAAAAVAPSALPSAVASAVAGGSGGCK